MTTDDNSKKRALHASYGASPQDGCKNTGHVEDVQRHGGCSSCGRILSMAARRDANS